MKRHPFDATSFLAGMVLGAIALAYLATEVTDWDLDGRWVLPLVLVGLGIAGIVGSLSGLRRTDAVDVTPPGSPQPVPPSPPDEEAPAARPE